jgi:hypothetical protein
MACINGTDNQPIANLHQQNLDRMLGDIRDNTSDRLADICAQLFNSCKNEFITDWKLEKDGSFTITLRDSFSHELVTKEYIKKYLGTVRVQMGKVGKNGLSQITGKLSREQDQSVSQIAFNTGLKGRFRPKGALASLPIPREEVKIGHLLHKKKGNKIDCSIIRGKTKQTANFNFGRWKKVLGF